MHQLFVMLGPGVIFEAANFTLVEKTPPPAPAFQDYLSYRNTANLWQSLPSHTNGTRQTQGFSTDLAPQIGQFLADSNGSTLSTPKFWGLHYWYLIDNEFEPKLAMNCVFQCASILQLARLALSTIHFASSADPKRTKAALSGLPSPGKTWQLAQRPENLRFPTAFHNHPRNPQVASSIHKPLRLNSWSEDDWRVVEKTRKGQDEHLATHHCAISTKDFLKFCLVDVQPQSSQYHVIIAIHVHDDNYLLPDIAVATTRRGCLVMFPTRTEKRPWHRSPLLATRKILNIAILDNKVLVSDVSH